MRKLIKSTFRLTSLMLLLFTLSGHAQTPDTLTNTKIVELYSKGLSTSVIINKIKTSPTNFNVSTDTLIKLKEQKIPDEITNAMIDASAKNTTSTVADPNDPMTSHSSGIYHHSVVNGNRSMQKLEATVCTQVKYGSGIGASLTYGIASTKMKATLDGAASRVQLTDTLPVFYFYFDQTTTNNALNTSSAWFSPSSSPNEFILVKMDSKKSSREFVTGKSNAYTGTSLGVDDKYKVAFDFELVSPGVYRVKPKTALKSGEYCFMYAGSAAGSGQGGKVFDFGVQAASTK